MNGIVFRIENLVSYEMYALPYILRLPFISFIAQIVNTSPSHKLYIVFPGR